MGYIIFGTLVVLLFLYLTWKTFKSKKIKSLLKIPIIFLTVFMILVGLIFIFDRPTTNTSNQSKNKELTSSKVSSKTKSSKKATLGSKKTTSANPKLSVENNALQKNLTQSLGFALGKLDKDGNPTNSGTPDDNFKWATYVQKVEINSNRELQIYVDPRFQELSAEDQESFVHSAYGMADGTDELKLTADEQESGLSATVLNGSKVIGYTTGFGKYHAD